MRNLAIVAVLLIFFIGFIGFINYKSIQENFIERFVSQTNVDVQNEVENKKQFNLALAILLSKDERIVRWLKEKRGALNLAEIAQMLQERTIFRNISFKIVDRDFHILYSTLPLHKIRRYDYKRGASLFSDIVVDCYGLHISAFGRVEDEGYVEVLSQFNSIRRNLQRERIYALTLVDKRYKDRAKLVKNRVGEYAIMDDSFDLHFYELVATRGIEKILKSFEPVVVEGFVIYRYPLKNSQNQIVGWIVYGKDMGEIFDQYLSKNILLRLTILGTIVLAVLMVFAYYYQKERKKLLSEQVEYYGKLLDRLQEIIIITDGKSIKFANASFFRYFNGFKNLDEFKRKHRCICDFFVEEDGFLRAWMEDKSWTEYLLEHPEESSYAKVRYNNSEYIFQVKANRLDRNDFVVIFIDVTENYRRQERLRKLATRDPLTGLYNRYVFEKIAAEKIEEAKILGDDLLFVMIDIDHFKQINDRYGHDVGDMVIQEMARLIRKSFRSTDPVFRIGGEEFLIVLVTSNIPKILDILEQLRQRVQKRSFKGINVTISIGVAQYREGDSVQSLYKRVDTALYRSKNSGRNTITFIGANDE